MTEKASYTENELLLQIREGDESAFAQFFYNYKNKLYGFLLNITHNATQSKDIVQEVFLKVWINREKLAEVENMNAWLFTLARNHAIDQLRKIAAEIKMTTNLSLRQETASQEADAITHLYYKESRQKIQEAIDHLSPQQKKIYLLHREQGLKLEEIAQKLNLSVSTVQNHLFRATAAIRDYLARYYPDIALSYIIIAGAGWVY